MRLNREQAREIVRCVHRQFGDDAEVMLFGSRLDDSARGGDVDLLIESAEPPTLRQRAMLKVALEQALNLPVDVVATQRGRAETAFVRIARTHARSLKAETA